MYVKAFHGQILLMPRTEYTAMEGKSSCQSSALFQFKFTTKTRPLKMVQILICTCQWQPSKYVSINQTMTITLKGYPWIYQCHNCIELKLFPSQIKTGTKTQVHTI